MKFFTAVLGLLVGYITCCVIANSQIRSDSLTYIPILGDTSPGGVWPQPQSQQSSSKVMHAFTEFYQFTVLLH